MVLEPSLRECQLVDPVVSSLSRGRRVGDEFFVYAAVEEDDDAGAVDDGFPADGLVYGFAVGSLWVDVLEVFERMYLPGLKNISRPVLEVSILRGMGTNNRLNIKVNRVRCPVTLFTSFDSKNIYSEKTGNIERNAVNQRS